MSEINTLGPAPLFVEPAAENHIRQKQERISLYRSRRGLNQVARRQRETVCSQTDNRQRRAMRSVSPSSTAVAESTGEQARRSAGPWKEQIPPGAIFYDEMADITAGINHPGMFVSKRG